LKTNITYIISNIDKALAFEWVEQYLNKDKYNLSFILLNSGDSVLETYLSKKNVLCKRIHYTGKKDIPKSIYHIHRFLKKNKISIIHTHLFDANICGLIAGWMAKIPKRIYTRHHSNFHHQYYPHAVKYDKLANRLSTDIIAISEVVKRILIEDEGTPKHKVHVIHHGFELSDFSSTPISAIELLNKKYNSNMQHPVIGVISRYTELKGIQYIIPAFEKLLKIYPDALLILAGGTGSYKNEIKKLLDQIPDKNYLEIKFENNIFALYRVFDIFVHVPIHNEMEAFGQTYVEALASGIPSVFTLSGISNEFIKHKHNALVVSYKNSDEIYNSIIELLEDKSLREKLIFNGKKDVNSLFELHKMISSLEAVYG